MADTQSRPSEFVHVKNNPAPDGARVVWFQGASGRSLRTCLAPALSAFRTAVGPAGIWWGFIAGLAVAAIGLSARFHARTTFPPRSAR